VSPTTAEMTFHLERHDGPTVDPSATLTLSADGRRLTLLIPGSNPAQLHRS
jgi:hypothetical protein